MSPGIKEEEKEEKSNSEQQERETASPGVLTAGEDNSSNPRPVQILGEALRRPKRQNHLDKNKEELQKACKALGLQITGNKPELRKRLIQREQEREAAASFFKQSAPGAPPPGQNPNRFTLTPVKKQPKSLPLTPSTRRKREAGSDNSPGSLGTPSKRGRQGRDIMEDETTYMNEVMVGRLNENPGEAKNAKRSDLRDQGGQRNDKPIHKGDFPLRITALQDDHNQSELKSGRPGRLKYHWGRTNRG